MKNPAPALPSTSGRQSCSHRGAMQVIQRLRCTQGFTLLEILIVTVLLGIMAEVVDYGFLSQMPQRRLQGAARQLTWELMQARAQAIKRHSNIRLSFPDNHVFAIWNDLDHDGVVDTGEETMQDLHDHYADVIVDIDTLMIASPLFTSRGTSSGNSTILIKNAAGSKNLSINVSGFITVD